MPESLSHGLWGQAGVPHKGWNCIDINDLGEPSQTCEMCASATIRYVHYMQHPGYSQVLSVGCICAEHMSGDYVGTKARDDLMRTLDRRKDSWRRKIWKTSQKGNPYLKSEGFVCSLYQQQGAWRFCILRAADQSKGFSAKGFADQAAAKDAVLAALTAVKKGLLPLPIKGP